MNLINQTIKHPTLGVGYVTEQNNKYIWIKFANKTSKFKYPDAFTKILKCEDPKTQETLEEESPTSKAIKEAQKLAEKKYAAEVAARKTTRQSLPFRKKAVIKQQRISGQRMTFYVFQGSTYDRESRSEYLWAPVSNKSGQTFHHWERMLDIQAGDIIFHGHNGYIKAVSMARNRCYACSQPEELRTEDLWDKEGRKVDCNYIPIKRPIKTSTLKEDILRLCNVKYAPFDSRGKGNMGYLYDLNRELAAIFLRESVKQNAYLEDVDYIRDLISEADKV